MYLYRPLLLMIPLLSLLLPPLLELWLFGTGHWYRPFLIWLGLCMLVALIEQRHRHEL